MHRRHFGLLLGAPLLALPRLRLIAHRGGIVDDTHPENTVSSLEAAIRAGYWMVEVDVRASRDGEPLLHHDATLERFFKRPERPEDLTWRELSQLRSTPGGDPPFHFEQLCQLCRGRIRLMLDIKTTTQPPAFYNRMARLMQDNGLLQTAYMLGGDRWRHVFGSGGARESANRKALTAAAQYDENVASRYFLFELASDLDEEAFALTRHYNTDCVAAVNTFRYTQARRDEWEGPKQDIARLRALGVTSYQIDSRYQSLLLEN